MDREVSYTVELGAAMIAMAIVIYFVVNILYLGNIVKANAVESAVDMKSDLETGQLASLNNKEDLVLPKAAMYSIIAKEFVGMEELEVDGERYLPNKDGLWSKDGMTNTGEDFVHPEDILLKSLGGKVKVLVNRSGTGLYKVVLSKFVK